MKIRGREIKVNVYNELEPYLTQFKKHKIVDGKLVSCSPFRYSDNTPSFFVRLEPFEDVPEGVWSDSGAYDDYKSGNLIRLLAFLQGVSEDECEHYLYETYTGEYTEKLELTMPKFVIKNKKQPLPIDSIQTFQNPCDYLTQRGISHQTQTLMKTGYDPKTKSVILPWYDGNNQLANIKYRRVDSKIFYYQKGGIPIQQLLYGLNYIYQTNATYSVLCESEIDALTLINIGIPAMALGGSNYHDKKLELIKSSPLNEIIIITDNDTVGVNLRQKLENKLMPFIKVSHGYVPPPYKDINEVPDEHLLREMIENKIKKYKNFKLK